MKMKSAEQWVNEFNVPWNEITRTDLLILVKMVQLDAVRSVDAQSHFVTVDQICEQEKEVKVLIKTKQGLHES